MKKYDNYRDLHQDLMTKGITLEEFKVISEKMNEEEKQTIKELIERGNTYLESVIKLDTSSKELYTEERELQAKVYELQRKRNDTDKKLNYLTMLQYANEPKYPKWEKSYNEMTYYKYNLTDYRLYAGNDYHVFIKERVNLKVWKFEVHFTTRIDNGYSDAGEVHKYKTFAEAEVKAKELKREIFESHKNEIDTRFELQKMAYEVQIKLSKYSDWTKHSYARKLYN